MLKIPPAITGHCFPSGHAMTETMRPASLIVIGHNPGGGPVMPRVPLVLTGPAGPSAPQGPGTGKVSGTGWTGPGQDRSGLWLRNAAAGLCVLAAAAAAVSFTAQYRMAETARHLPVVAALEAAIPDAAALVFACLGIALALHGRRALRARALNLASVGASVFMNAIAAAPGWRNLAIWALPPVAYALASDTLIGVVRARALARHLQLGAALAADAATPLAVLGGLALWLLRLALAPASTLAGFRAWVLAECPVAPGRRAPAPRPAPAPPPRKATKTARFLALATERHGSLASIPLDAVAAISADLAPRVGLHPGTARAALRKAVLAATERRPPMIIKLAIALAVVLIVAAFAAWAFLPARHLPGNRARHLRIRLHLRLHPGKGFAHAFSLWLRWSRFAVLRRSGRIRPALPLRYRFLDPREHSVFLGRAHYRHGLRVPLEEHLLVDGAAADVQDRVPGRRHPALPRPGHRHQHQTGRVRADQRGPRAARPGARVQPAAHRRRPVHLLLVPGRRLPGPGDRDPPRRRVRVRRVPEGRRGRHLLVRQSQRLPARLLPRRRPGRLRPARRRRLGLRRRPAHPRTDPGRRRRPPVGVHPGRAPRRGPQDRRHSPDGHEPGPGVHGRPRPGGQRPARPGHRVRHPRLPARRGHRVHDRRSRLRGRPGRPAVRRHGVRDPLDRGADRARRRRRGGWTRRC